MPQVRRRTLRTYLSWPAWIVAGRGRTKSGPSPFRPREPRGRMPCHALYLHRREESTDEDSDDRRRQYTEAPTSASVPEGALGRPVEQDRAFDRQPLDLILGIAKLGEHFSGVLAEERSGATDGGGRGRGARGEGEGVHGAEPG